MSEHTDLIASPVPTITRYGTPEPTWEYRRGRSAAHQLWHDWCQSLLDAGTPTRTVEQLLRLPEGRQACWICARAAKAYSAEAEQYARRPVVRQAVALLRERLGRRKAAQRMLPESGRIARLCEERRLERTRAVVLATAVYRTARHGHTGHVRLGEPGADSDTGKDWNVYRGAFKGWSATTSSHTYTVPRDWLETVHARGLACCDGLLTLAAEPIQGHGPELYRAIWVEQSRGMAITAIRGYIARLDHDSHTYTYHGPSARAALDGVQRKARLKPARRQGTVDLDRLLRRHGDLPVYWGDHKGIACDSGTRSWCQAVGIDPEEGCTVADVIAGYRLRPHPEALQIVRRVVRSGRAPLDLSVPPSSLESPGGRVVFDAEGGFRVDPSDS